MFSAAKHDAPPKTASMLSALKDLKLTHLWVIYPGKEKYQLDKKITVLPFLSPFFRPQPL
jgi:hypothetical protein